MCISTLRYDWVFFSVSDWSICGLLKNTLRLYFEYEFSFTFISIFKEKQMVKKDCEKNDDKLMQAKILSLGKM